MILSGNIASAENFSVSKSSTGAYYIIMPIFDANQSSMQYKILSTSTNNSYLILMINNSK